MKKTNTKKLILLSLMVAYSLALYILETFIPNPLLVIFPGAKLGLSNIITLICLITFGFKDTFFIL
ncbi:heptaprenyl diphosphate synthase, partial [Peptostreptococcus russellii]